MVVGHDGSSYSNKLYVADLSPVSKAAGGMNHSLILKEDSSLWAMGENQYGQSGDGTPPIGPHRSGLWMPISLRLQQGAMPAIF